MKLHCSIYTLRKIKENKVHAQCHQVMNGVSSLIALTCM